MYILLHCISLYLYIYISIDAMQYDFIDENSLLHPSKVYTTCPSFPSKAKSHRRRDASQDPGGNREDVPPNHEPPGEL